MMVGPNTIPESLERFRCTVDEWRTLRNVGIEMMRHGKGKDTTPLRAFARQRNAAINERHIGWELSLWQWWTIWQDSGHWHERSNSRGGYMMCRKGDIGPYAVGNVFIGPGEENCAGNKRSGLPLGVRRSSGSKLKPYVAVCHVGGKPRYLGSFAAPEAAHAAYLVARDRDLLLKAVNSNFATIQVVGSIG